MKHALEFRRKLAHIAFGVVLVMLLAFDWLTPVYLLVAFLVALPITLLEPRRRIPIISQLMDLIERSDQRHKWPGKGFVFYILGSYLALLLFPKDIAYASILILAFGDAISHLFGINFGRRKHPLSERKFLEGAVAGFLAGSIAAAAVVPLIYAVFGSLVAMLVEGVEMRFRSEKIDDNLILPIVAGLTMFLVSLVVG